MTILIEAAVESLDDALAAVHGGAHRLEICADLDAGGTTPTREVIESVLAHVTLPVLVMIRPRAGDFVYSPGELDRMAEHIDTALALGASGVVFGTLDARRRVDIAAARRLVTATPGKPVTFHRAIDDTLDPLAAVDDVMSIGVTRVLSSGGATTALDGAEALRAMVERAGTTLSIVAGGGVRASNVAELVRRSGVLEVHARCAGDAARIAGIARAVAPLAQARERRPTAP
ncbi:MAG TPA: copper homeostasis protein CutC [Gemmatimonadaceae bacterium]|nr:copper homeostasis protein CutC [Gemmatimonadaceae bacterium]